MQTNLPPQEESLEAIITGRILRSENFAEYVDQLIKQRIDIALMEQKLTYENIAREWQISIRSAKGLNEKQLNAMCLKKVKIGSMVRFYRTGKIEASRELLRHFGR